MTQEFHFTTLDQEQLSILIKDSIADALQDWQHSEMNKLQLPEFSTRKEVATLLRISLPTVDDYIKRGIIEAVRISGRVRIKDSEVRKALTAIKSQRYKRR
ncbi:helix-turn-helix domain-containing protein [Dyadobacter fanqingshengii]|uniref:Helix-turn-helix domain-containing protein n=1 Tax=Dyadobacter fanqingshengii TaxID=2906443 RepID=A0A9X1PFR1_9BACT|nr:helix-turn-helix domain-containing protein [Dyadobacter fanqingshengii]MCF0043630.1 helix-turn-helix domain-containing protein [Dyadobacter fanqingshengii]USJ34754.1 helix-turn-helix domain-containing protein [Dyadobacter fanqingshengii]